MVNMQAMQELLSSLGLLSSLQLLIKTKTDELGTKNSTVQLFKTYDVRTPVTDRSLLSGVSSKDECKVSISVGLITLMFFVVTE